MSSNILYKSISNSKKRRFKKHCVEIDYIYQSYFKNYALTSKFLNTSVTKFINLLGFEFVEYAINKACDTGLDNLASIKYFCGICWTEIKKEVENERL